MRVAIQGASLSVVCVGVVVLRRFGLLCSLHLGMGRARFFLCDDEDKI